MLVVDAFFLNAFGVGVVAQSHSFNSFRVASDTVRVGVGVVGCCLCGCLRRSFSV